MPYGSPPSNPCQPCSVILEAKQQRSWESVDADTHFDASFFRVQFDRFDIFEWNHVRVLRHLFVCMCACVHVCVCVCVARVSSVGG